VRVLRRSLSFVVVVIVVVVLIAVM
jgi:hypothetical protein